MATVFNVRQRLDFAFEMKTTENRIFSNDSSVMIKAVAVPPCKIQVSEREVLMVDIGSKTMFEYPVNLLIDMYQACRSEPVQPIVDIYHQTGEQLSMIIESILNSRKDVHATHFDKLRMMHKDIRSGIETANMLMAGRGLLLEHSLLVPPRQTITARCLHGSQITVYMSGIKSEILD